MFHHQQHPHEDHYPQFSPTLTVWSGLRMDFLQNHLHHQHFATLAVWSAEPVPKMGKPRRLTATLNWQKLTTIALINLRWRYFMLPFAEMTPMFFLFFKDLWCLYNFYLPDSIFMSCISFHRISGEGRTSLRKKYIEDLVGHKNLFFFRPQLLERGSRN